MRTIETTAVVSADHTMTLTVPADIPAGDYEVVVIVEAGGPTPATPQAPISGMNRTIVTFNWEGPLSIQEARARDDPADSGLYQICAWHRVFGPGALVYIGETVGQTFGVRLRQHTWLEGEREVKVYLGRLAGAATLENGDNLIKAAEKLALYYHSPPFNSSGLINEPTGLFIHVQNWGDIGPLMMEFSSDWPPRGRS